MTHPSRPATVVEIVLYHLRHRSGCTMRGLPGTDGYTSAAADAILSRMPTENRTNWTKVAV